MKPNEPNISVDSKDADLIASELQKQNARVLYISETTFVPLQ